MEDIVVYYQWSKDNNTLQQSKRKGETKMKRARYNEVPKEYRRDYKKEFKEVLAAIAICIFTVLFLMCVLVLGWHNNNENNKGRRNPLLFAFIQFVDLYRRKKSIFKNHYFKYTVNRKNGFLKIKNSLQKSLIFKNN